MLDLVKFTARLFLAMAAMPALQPMLMRASATLLAVDVQPLVLPEYHSYEQQAQHVKAMLNQP